MFSLKSMVSFRPSYDVGSLFLPLADPMLAGPSVPTRGMLISTFFPQQLIRCPVMR